MGAASQASQPAPDLKPSPVQVKGISAPDDSGPSFMLLDKALLHFLAGSYQACRLFHLPASIQEIRILPGLDPPLQVFCHLPQLAHGFLERPQQIGRPRNPVFRGNQSHVSS
jgi:hypothetical protein